MEQETTPQIPTDPAAPVSADSDAAQASVFKNKGSSRKFSPQASKRRGGGFSHDTRPHKVCKFCTERDTKIDYKDINILRNFISGRGKLLGARTTGLCASHQREITYAIKRARIMALLPFAAA